MYGRIILAPLIVTGCLVGTEGGRAPAGSRRPFHRDPGLTIEEHGKIVGLMRLLQSDDIRNSERAQNELFKMGPVVVMYARQLLSPDETRRNVRLAATRVIIHNASIQNAQELVELLDYPHALVRHDAAVALKRLTGITFGFDHLAPPEERKAVILKWKQWLAERG